MAINTINTRIQLKYDTLSNWIISSNNNFVPLKGEVCIAEIPTNDSNDNHLNPPAIGIKVGDGTNTFVNLPWIQAIAGDVYSWAKAPEKPIYQANEIRNLDTYISGQIQDTDTQYRIIQGTESNVNKYYLQKKEIQENQFSYVNVDENENPIPFLDLTNILNSIAGGMHFIGVSDTPLIDSNNNSLNPIINGNEITNLNNGDIIIYETTEYIWDGNTWLLLGDENRKINNNDIAPGANIINTIEKITVPSDSGSGPDKELTINNKTVKLAKIAETNSIYDIEETNHVNNVDFFVFDCGSATTLINNINTDIGEWDS